ncbi:MAG: DNA recombination protein RmuC [Flavobacteriaceae bacterium]
MDIGISYFFIGLGLLLIGYLIGSYILKLKIRSSRAIGQEQEKYFKQQLHNIEQQLEKEKEEKERLRTDKERLGLLNSRHEADMENLRQKNKEQKEEVEKVQQRLSREFEIMANKILDEKSQKFTKQNKENLENILNPLKEKIKTFEDKVEKTHKESIDYHAALRQQIFGLKELNEQMSKEAVNLTRALKGDSKIQGNWGELVLERVLEKSGLEKDREYSVQQSFVNRDGSRVLPDVIINLPDGKKMVIDSKVSLTDYERYINSEEEERSGHLKNHIASLKKHVEQLSSKKYEDLYEMESPDFVLMFIPIEPAFAIALNNDNDLYNKAFAQNIVIVTPTTLLATLRTIDSMWSNEKQQRNAIEIARQAGALYDKFEGFIGDLTRVGTKMDAAKGEYEEAMKKLYKGHGNLISRVENLKKMGAKAKKSIPENLMKRADETQ